jgi:hypothetical protein
MDVGGRHKPQYPYHMQQIFLSRQRAVHELLLRSRELMNETMPTGSVHSDRSDNAAIAHTEQLVLDVRAGRLHIFEFVDRDGTVLRVYVS